MYRTKDFIEELRAQLDLILPTYYEEAPSKATRFPYCVISGIKVTDLAQGDQIYFYLDIWGDEKAPETTVALEEYCDLLRNGLSGAVLVREGSFGAHLGFDSQNPMQDSEFDIAHRRLSMSARIFYN